MLKLYNQVTHSGVFGAYARGFHPMEVVLRHLKDLGSPLFAKIDIN